MGLTPEGTTLRTILSAPPSEQAGRALLEWARDIEARVVRGDLMLGILAIDDVKEVHSALARAGEYGIGEAWVELASWLANPPIGEPDLVGAEEALRAAVRLDVPKARHRFAELRWYYRRDEASEQERDETYHVVREILDGNPADPEAIYLLGLLTCQGFGTNADPTAAVELQRRAAELGSAAAQFELYVHYAMGLGVEKDGRAAFDANLKAVEAGHPRALYNMGSFHATGNLVPKDTAKAAEWYERAADAGNARAAATLAMMYATGDGVAQDAEYASELFDQAEYLGFDVSELRESVGL